MTAQVSRANDPEELNTGAGEASPGTSAARRERFATFVTIAMGILVVITLFICATWNHFLGRPAHPVLQVVAALLPLSFVPAHITGMSRSGALLRFWYRLSAAAMGVFSFFMVASIACWIVDGAALLAGLKPFVHPLAMALYGFAALASGYGILNAAWVRTTRVTVRLPHVPEAWRGRTVALVSDLHLGNVRGAGLTRRIVARLTQSKPDAVFITGDMFDGTTARLRELVKPWTAFSAPKGVYYVTGNHEEFQDRVQYMEATRSAGIRVLNNEKVVLDGLQIIGVLDGEATDPDSLPAVLQNAEIDCERASILLAHQPANLSIAESAGISLQLSGHTHAGQFWPWSKLVPRFHGRFAYGLNRLGKLQVLTTSGAGTWGPPMRVGTRSEIVLVRLEAE